MRRIQRIPSNTRRFSTHGRPPLGCLDGLGSKGAIAFHCASVSNGPERAIGPPSALLTLLIRHFEETNHHVFKSLYRVMQLLLVTGMVAERFGRRRTLILLSVLGAIGGLGLALTDNFFALVLLAFTGMLNAAGHDRGAAGSIEQVLVPESVSQAGRTGALARYNIVLGAGHALGALASGLPFLLRSQFRVGLLA